MTLDSPSIFPSLDTMWNFNSLYARRTQRGVVKIKMRHSVTPDVVTFTIAACYIHYTMQETFKPNRDEPVRCISFPLTNGAVYCIAYIVDQWWANLNHGDWVDYWKIWFESTWFVWGISMITDPCFTIRYDSVYLVCSKKLTSSQLNLPHRMNRKIKMRNKK